LCAWWYASRLVETNTRESFLNESERTVDLVIERLGHYEDTLWGGVGLMDSSEQVTAEEWRQFTKSTQIVERYPGINGLGVIFKVPERDMPEFLAGQRLDRPSFRAFPAHSESTKWPITYIEPASINAQAVGLDVAFETNRREGIEAARDTGKAQVTGPIVLVQDSKKTPGFLFYAPFYAGKSNPQAVSARRASIIGVTYAPFVMKKLMKGTLDRNNREFTLDIRDQGQTLYAESPEKNQSPSELAGGHQSGLSTSQSVEVYGRTWTFDFVADPGFGAATESNQPKLILIGGILIDILLLTMFWMLSKSNRRALAYADDVTEDLKRNKALLERSNADLEQFAFAASHDLKAPLRVIANLCQWVGEDLEQIFDKGGDVDPDERKEVELRIEQIYSRTRSLNGLLDSLLGYARVGKTSEESKSIDTRELVQDIASLVQDSDDFEVLVNGHMPRLHSERAPLEMVFQNLVVNAIKHHDQSAGSIAISAIENDQFVTFTVADDGPGIEEEYREKIFDLFTTLAPKAETGSSGMGLALIKKIVEERECSVWVQPHSASRGTTIRFTWPKEAQWKS